LFAALLLTVGGPARAEVPYEVTFAPTGDDALDSAIEEASQLSALTDHPPDSDAALRSRVSDDKGRINAVARSLGYYDDTVEITTDMKASPVKVTVTVTPGPQYLLAKVTVIGAGGKPLPLGSPVTTTEDLKLEIGKPAIAAPVATANGLIEHKFQEHGFPFAHIARRIVTIDHRTYEMTVVYEVDPGPAALFGPTRITGLEDVREAYVDRRLRWETGQPYDVTLLEKTRDALVASNLFSTVEIKAEKIEDINVAPMSVDVTERPPRSVAAGVSYASSEGVSANVTWEHRNLFGEAEDLKFGLLVGQELSAATADFRKPDMFGIGWDLVSNITIDKETTDAYDSKGGRISAGFEYKAFEHIAFGAGLSLEHARISDYEIQQHYTLVGIPAYVRRDATDDLLNPTTGDREALNVTPYTDPTGSSGLTFLSGKLTGSIYQRLGDTDEFVVALLGAVGATLGVSLEDLPKDKRFYVGGGGSVRGYAFQHAGPIGIHDDPVGGLSSFETSLELRYKLTETIGLVPFVDAGSVYDTSFPDLSKRLFIGAGLGVRYYTGLGPLRLDVAAPLHRRGGDHPFQLYVSLGQAF
jgi:translocation and assembly module TamA